jgi:hypothetical protein
VGGGNKREERQREGGVTGGNGMAEGERKLVRRQQARGRGRCKARRDQDNKRQEKNGRAQGDTGKAEYAKTREIAQYLYVIRE